MKVLYIEDDPVDVDLTRHAFRKSRPDLELDVARSQREALEKIKGIDVANYDLVLTDMHLGDGDGLAILSHIRSRSIPLPVVILTGQGDEEFAVAALKAGAENYIVKKSGYLDSLPRILEEAHASFRTGQERKAYSLKVLYVEHNQADVDLTLRHFRQHAPHIAFSVICRVAEFITLLQDSQNKLAHYDVILLDYRLPQENALELLKRIKDSIFSKIPVILITGKGDEEIAVQALRIGAFDYVTKNQGYLYKLPSAIENANYSVRLEREHQALLESEQRYRSLFENNHTIMLVIDPLKQQIVDANPAAVNFYGWPREAFKGKPVTEINTLSAAEMRKQIQAAANEDRNHFIFKHYRADGSVCDVEVYSGPIEISGKPLLYSIVYDISKGLQVEREKEKLRAQLVQAQKMEAVGQLAGGIAHDFNNILSPILGFTELALEDVETGSQLEDSLQEVYRAAKRAGDLVKQILAFARQTGEDRKPVELGLVVKEALKLLRSTIPTSIEINGIIESTALVLGNATQLHQIILNLCTNAYHAMENTGGVLSVHLEDFSNSPSRDNPHPELTHDDYIQLTIADTGIGIPADIMESIFEPYFTTKEPGQGTGMGLAMVHGIVEAYSGKIFVESVPGEGSRFTIFLPATKQPPSDNLYVSETLPSGQERLLFIDDEVAITKIGNRILSSLGYTVTTMTSSTAALDLFRNTPEAFDLVLTDMTMPKMNGDQLAVELRGIRADIPIILCTGYSKQISDEYIDRIGINRLLFKPITKSDLARAVRHVLDGTKG